MQVAGSSQNRDLLGIQPPTHSVITVMILTLLLLLLLLPLLLLLIIITNHTTNNTNNTTTHVRAQNVPESRRRAAPHRPPKGDPKRGIRKNRPLSSGLSKNDSNMIEDFLLQDPLFRIPFVWYLCDGKKTYICI